MYTQRIIKSSFAGALFGLHWILYILLWVLQCWLLKLNSRSIVRANYRCLHPGFLCLELYPVCLLSQNVWRWLNYIKLDKINCCCNFYNLFFYVFHDVWLFAAVFILLYVHFRNILLWKKWAKILKWMDSLEFLWQENQALTTSL